MGSGKKNFRALRFSNKFHKKKEMPKEEETQKNKEDVDRLVALFQKKKK